MPRDETELKAMVKKAALVVKDHPIEVPEGGVNYDFQFGMIVTDFDKKVENLH